MALTSFQTCDSMRETDSNTLNEAIFAPQGFFAESLPAKIDNFIFTKYKDPNVVYDVDSFLTIFTEKYSLINENQIYSYLIRKPFLINLVVQTIEKIKEYFTSHIEDLTLEVFYDPEDEDLSGKLFLMIKNNLEIEEASKVSNKFLQEWFIPHARDNLIYFNIDII